MICNRVTGKITIKVVAGDKSRFTSHQKNHFIQVGSIYINYHASLLEKKQRLMKIS